METLSVTFSYENNLKIPLLLVEVTPFDVLIGVKIPNQASLTYESINPQPFRSLEDLVLNFLARSPEFQDVTAAVIALPLSLLEPQSNTPPLTPYNSWVFDLSLFKKAVGFSNVIFIDRATVIGKAIPLLMPSDFFILSGEQAAYFNASKNTYMLALTDETYESVFLSFNASSKRWESTKNLVNNLEIDTYNEALQNILNKLGQNVSVPDTRLTFFFSSQGLEKLYEALYQENNMEAFLKRKIQISPMVLQKGAPTDVDSLELNNTITRSSLEGLDVSIASIEPNNSQKISRANSFLPLSLKNTLSLSQDDLDWNLLKGLPFMTILREAFSFKGGRFQAPVDPPSGVIPPDIEKLCFSCLNMWVELLGETLGRQALLLNAKGGVFLSGRLLFLIKGLLNDLSLNAAFEKEISGQSSFTETSFALITNPIPAFLGMISLFEEQTLTS